MATSVKTGPTRTQPVTGYRRPSTKPQPGSVLGIPWLPCPALLPETPTTIQLWPTTCKCDAGGVNLAQDLVFCDLQPLAACAKRAPRKCRRGPARRSLLTAFSSTGPALPRSLGPPGHLFSSRLTRSQSAVVCGTTGHRGVVQTQALPRCVTAGNLFGIGHGAEDSDDSGGAAHGRPVVGADGRNMRLGCAFSLHATPVLVCERRDRKMRDTRSRAMQMDVSPKSRPSVKLQGVSSRLVLQERRATRGG